jgi:MFS transporter, AAHS family, 3-hydroxyphenylpropionic acid transporter
LSDAPAPAPYATATIAGCVLAAFCEGFDLQAAGVAAGGIVPEFAPSADQLGTFFSASTLGLFAGALAGGRLADSLGRKPVLIASIFLFGCFSLLTAAAWDIHSLSWARLLTGAGLGGALPILLALVNECSAAHRRRANVALAYCAMPFGGALASLLSMLNAPAHWRLIFLAGGVGPLLLAPVLLWVAQESPAFVRLPRRTPSAQAAVASGTALSSRAGSFIAIFAEGRALPTVLLWSSTFLALLTLYLLVSWLPTLLVGSGLSKPQAAGAQIAFNTGGGLAALVMGQLLESRWRNAAIVAAFLALPTCVLLLGSRPGQFILLLGVVFALGCAVLAGLGFLYATAPECYPAPIRGVGTGVAVAAGRLGSIVGPKLGGTLQAAGRSSSQLLSDILPLIVLGSVVGLAFAWSIARQRRAAVRAMERRLRSEE